MQKIQLSLEDTPLFVGSLYPNAYISFTWLKQTTWIKPLKLSKELTNLYEDKMGWILRQYHALQKQDDLRFVAPHVLPYAAKVGLEINVSRSDLIRSIPKLFGVPTDYSKQLARSLADSLEIETSAFSAEDVFSNSSGSLISDRQRTRLIKWEPLNELSLLTSELYDQSQLGWLDIENNIDELNYDQKSDILRRIINYRLEKMNLTYYFEIVAEPHVAMELNHVLLPVDIKSQLPTPAHGYNIPKVNDGGILQRCFDISYELYSQLQATNPNAALLACLYGHRQRFLVELNASTLSRLYNRQLKLTAPALNIVKFMRKEISNKHQIIGTWLEDKEKSDRKKSGASSSKG